MTSWVAKRVAIAAQAYDKWPESFKEAFRLSAIVDRIPPTLQEGIALLAEVDRLTSELASVREERAALENEGLLGSINHNNYGMPADQIAEALAFELEVAEMDRNDYVTINRKKLEGIAQRIIAKVEANAFRQGAEAMREAAAKHLDSLASIRCNSMIYDAVESIRALPLPEKGGKP